METQKEKKLYQNINEVSFYFFIILSITHLISGLALSNELYIRTAWLVNRLTDIPFLIVSLIYCLSFIKLLLMKNKFYNQLFDLITVSLGGLFILILIIYDLLIPNQLPLL